MPVPPFGFSTLNPDTLNCRAAEPKLENLTQGYYSNRIGFWCMLYYTNTIGSHKVLVVIAEAPIFTSTKPNASVSSAER